MVTTTMASPEELFAATTGSKTQEEITAFEQYVMKKTDERVEESLRDLDEIERMLQTGDIDEDKAEAFISNIEQHTNREEKERIREEERAKLAVGNTKAETFKKEGNTAFQKGDYNLAIEKYSAALECRKWASLYTNRAQAYLKLLNNCKDASSEVSEMAKNAIEDCDAALVVEPKNVKALYRKAVALGETNSLKESASLLRQVLEIEPHNQEVKRYLSKVTQVQQETKTQQATELLAQIGLRTDFSQLDRLMKEANSSKTDRAAVKTAFREIHDIIVKDDHNREYFHVNGGTELVLKQVAPFIAEGDELGLATLAATAEHSKVQEYIASQDQFLSDLQNMCVSKDYNMSIRRTATQVLELCSRNVNASKALLQVKMIHTIKVLIESESDDSNMMNSAVTALSNVIEDERFLPHIVAEFSGATYQALACLCELNDPILTLSVTGALLYVSKDPSLQGRLVREEILSTCAGVLETTHDFSATFHIETASGTVPEVQASSADGPDANAESAKDLLRGISGNLLGVFINLIQIAGPYTLVTFTTAGVGKVVWRCLGYTNDDAALTVASRAASLMPKLCQSDMLLEYLEGSEDAVAAIVAACTFADRNSTIVDGCLRSLGRLCRREKGSLQISSQGGVQGLAPLLQCEQLNIRANAAMIYAELSRYEPCRDQLAENLDIINALVACLTASHMAVMKNSAMSLARCMKHETICPYVENRYGSTAMDTIIALVQM
eukprot:GFYU01010028.1.p1 GENE.GFYU01010028.1~~GFYU01010028.1.p1  ORF type:complete len:729 (-),score=137.59 GFYU01010028.1:75-2261(-)